MPKITLLKAGGGALGALAIGAVVALVSSPIVFDDNSATSNELPFPLIEIAEAGPAQACDDPKLSWTATDRIDGLEAEVDLLEHLNGPGWTGNIVDVCLRSRTSRSTSLVITSENEIDTEVSCETSEGAAGDTCKTVGDPGELGSKLFTTGGASDPCVPGFFMGTPLSSFSSGAGAKTLSVANGRTCRLTFGLRLSDTLSASEVAVLQTDKVQFDIVVTASQS